MNARFIASQAAALELRRSELQALLASEQSDFDTIVRDVQPELEERSELEVELKYIARLSDHHYEELVAVAEALERVKTGRYGTCASCGDEIEEARLLALPATQLCIDCAESVPG